MCVLGYLSEGKAKEKSSSRSRQSIIHHPSSIQHRVRWVQAHVSVTAGRGWQLLPIRLLGADLTRSRASRLSAARGDRRRRRVVYFLLERMRARTAAAWLSNPIWISDQRQQWGACKQKATNATCHTHHALRHSLILGYSSLLEPRRNLGRNKQDERPRACAGASNCGQLIQQLTDVRGHSSSSLFAFHGSMPHCLISCLIRWFNYKMFLLVMLTCLP